MFIYQGDIESKDICINIRFQKAVKGSDTTRINQIIIRKQPDPWRSSLRHTPVPVESQMTPSHVFRKPVIIDIQPLPVRLNHSNQVFRACIIKDVQRKPVIALPGKTFQGPG